MNRLPSELLSFIFQILVDRAHPSDIYSSETHSNPATKLAQVCSHWRQVAVETGSLWSCIVFPYRERGNPRRIFATAELHLERTRGSPIALFLSYKGDDAEDPIFLSTLDLLGPYMKQLRSLTTRLPESEYIESLLERCLTNGTAGSLSRLEITGYSSSDHFLYRPNSQTFERLDNYLQSVRILKLCRGTISWKCAVFEQLDELTVCHLDTAHCPTLTQLANVLSASPSLRSLRLSKMSITEDMDSVIRPPAKLEHLERLELDKLGDSSSCKALSVFSLGKQSLNLTFNADFNTSTVLTDLRRLAAETPVGRFHFTKILNRQPLQEILESLPDLKYLVLHELELEDSDLGILAHCTGKTSLSPLSPFAHDSPTSPLPRLEKLALVKCTILCDQEAFQKVASSLCLESFYLRGCYIEDVTKSEKERDDRLRRIDAKTELGIWLTKNTARVVTIK